jgi:hypothetical protein
MMKSSGFHKVLWDVMFLSNIQDALMGNHDIPDLVVPEDITTLINVSTDRLPLVIEGTSQVGRVKVFLSR